MAFLSLLIGFVLGAAALLFALQNNEIVGLTFLGSEFQTSLALVILIAIATGLLLGILLSIPSIISRSLTIMTLKREKRGLADEAQTMREMHAREESNRVVETTVIQPEVVDLRNH